MAASTSELKQVGRFGAIGIINTLIDFGILNLLRFGFGFGTLAANYFSTTVAMIFSFYANKHVVFKQERGSMLRQGLIFFAVTAVGIYGLQAGVLYLLTKAWQWPGNFAVDIVHLVRLGNILEDAFVRVNVAKAAAIGVSMVWNYIMYKRVVFK